MKHYRGDKEEQARHWMGEGHFGQEALLLDLDPYLYAIDQVLSHRISQIVHAREDERARPLAVLVPPEATVSWQLAYLAQHFDLSLWSDDSDAILQDAVSHFDAEIFSGELPPLIHGRLSLFVHTDAAWENRSQLRLALRDTASSLAADGEIIVVLRCRGKLSQLEVEWSDGSSSDLSEVLERHVIAGLSEPSQVVHLSLADFDPRGSEYLTAFLRRHRDFFGRNARDFFLDRMRDADFSEAFYSPQDGAARFATMICWRV